MKIILRTAAITALILTTSCGKDTANAIADIFDEEVEQIESTVLDVENVTNNVLIAGGTKMEGTPPTPNGTISLDVSDTGKIAFLNEGFDVALNSDATLTGAYIQFKSKDGSVSDSYYDVNLDANNTSEEGKSTRRRRIKKNGEFTSESKTDDDIALDVDFNTNIEPGEFCYILCVYDASGNISEPQEVCLTVESWGGNNDLVGFWKLTKSESTEDGETVSLDLGEEKCEFWSFSDCPNGGNYDLGQCSTRDVQEININGDGTYSFELRISGRHVDPSLSDENCEQVFSPTSFYYLSSGKWAYVSDEDRLALLEYEYEEGYEDTSANEDFKGTNDVGQAYILYDGTTQLDGNTFIMTDTYYNDDDSIESIDKYYFEKE